MCSEHRTIAPWCVPIWLFHLRSCERSLGCRGTALADRSETTYVGTPVPWNVYVRGLLARLVDWPPKFGNCRRYSLFLDEDLVGRLKLLAGTHVLRKFPSGG